MAAGLVQTGSREFDRRGVRRVLGLTVGLVVTLLASAGAAIDAPPGAIDLRAGVEPLARQFDAERGQHRLLVLLSPA